MSTMTWEPAFPDSRLIDPACEVPRGTIAALDSVTPPVDQFKVETFGSVPPPGQILTKTKGFVRVLVTVSFRETDLEPTGSPQIPVINHVRISLVVNDPPVLIG